MNEFFDTLTSFVASPWAGPVVFVLALLDAFLPVVPSETVVVAGTALALAAGWQPVFLIWLVAAAGAFVGDHVSYAIGARAGRPLLERTDPGRPTRRARLLRAAQRQLTERGDTLVVSARFVPGGRTAVTLACGATGFPRRRFTALTAVGAAAWAGYCVLLGYLGTLAGHDVQSGVVWGCLLAVGSALTVELLRSVVRRRRVARPRPS